MVDRSTVGRSVKSVAASETGREKLSDLSSSGRPVATISLEMLQRGDAIVRGDRLITTRQLAFNLSIALRPGSWVFEGVGEMGSSEPHSRNQKPRGKLYLRSCWLILKLKGRSSYPILLQQMKLGSWHATILNLAGRKYPENRRQHASS